MLAGTSQFDDMFQDLTRQWPQIHKANCVFFQNSKPACGICDDDGCIYVYVNARHGIRPHDVQIGLNRFYQRGCA
jgi:hypothetical protein